MNGGDPNLFWFGCLLWLGGTGVVLSLFASGAQTPSKSSSPSEASEIEQLRQQCLRLREELQQQAKQLRIDERDSVFEQLQTLLTNYPTARMMTQSKADLPAKNLVALFTPLENLLKSWEYEPLGKPWEQVPYNPQWHQPDTDDIEEGEWVYIRFVGYRDGERILCPAKVSRTLPPGIQPKN